MIYESHLGSIEDINSAIAEGRFKACIEHDEARRVGRIRRMAERIAAGAPNLRVVLVAGPSSAGKTTTSIRLARWLEENGIRAYRLSTDDYFVDLEHTPKAADGSYDYESIDSVDHARLVADLSVLLSGDPVHMRHFDFLHKRGFDSEEAVRFAPGGVIIVEGIHALNPICTEGLEESVKFRVYLNTFTSLLAEADDTFLPDDTRLLRRIVRDAEYRNESPEATLLRWPSVEEGEVKWINPHRRLADAVFNTGLDYEPAVLKPYAMRALARVPSQSPVASHARRLAAALDLVAEASADDVPPISILRETIGGSMFDYV